MTRRRRRLNYDHLRYLIQHSLDDCPEFGGRVEVAGKINRIAEGIWHDNYWFRVQGRNLPAARSDQAFILRLLERRYDWQQGPEPRERLVREAESLRVLAQLDFSHPTPEFTCFVRDDESEIIGMIETALPGVSLDGRKERAAVRLIGRAAAAVHRMPIERFAHLPTSDDRAHHVKARIAELDDALFAEFPLAREVRGWIEAHLPSGDRRSLLHGDLLPQNLLCDCWEPVREDAVVGVIDWEMASIGDPAYDLAIVSRGNRKILGVQRGLEILVEAYLESGGKPISVTDVHVHELLLVLHWLAESWREHQEPGAGGHAPDFYETKLRSLFRRAAS